MRIPVSSLAALIALGAGLASPALAVGITPLSQVRNALSGSEPDYVATDFGPFDVAGRHVSTIGSQSMTADLESHAGTTTDEYGETVGYGNRSTFQVDFEIDEAASWSLTGSLGVTSNDFDGWTDASASVALRAYDPGTMSYQTIFEQAASSLLEYTPIAQTFDESGLLQAGQYQLYLFSRSQAFYHSFNGTFWSDSEAHLDFGLTALPEPGTGVLLGLGLALLGRRRPAREPAG